MVTGRVDRVVPAAPQRVLDVVKDTAGGALQFSRSPERSSTFTYLLRYVTAAATLLEWLEW